MKNDFFSFYARKYLFFRKEISPLINMDDSGKVAIKKEKFEYVDEHATHISTSTIFPKGKNFSCIYVHTFIKTVPNSDVRSNNVMKYIEEMTGLVFNKSRHVLKTDIVLIYFFLHGCIYPVEMSLYESLFLDKEHGPVTYLVQVLDVKIKDFCHPISGRRLCCAYKSRVFEEEWQTLRTYGVPSLTALSPYISLPSYSLKNS